MDERAAEAFTARATRSSGSSTLRACCTACPSGRCDHASAAHRHGHAPATLRASRSGRVPRGRGPADRARHLPLLPAGAVMPRTGWAGRHAVRGHDHAGLRCARWPTAPPSTRRPRAGRCSFGARASCSRTPGSTVRLYSTPPPRRGRSTSAMARPGRGVLRRHVPACLSPVPTPPRAWPGLQLMGHPPLNGPAGRWAGASSDPAPGVVVTEVRDAAGLAEFDRVLAAGFPVVRCPRFRLWHCSADRSSVLPRPPSTGSRPRPRCLLPRARRRRRRGGGDAASTPATARCGGAAATWAATLADPDSARRVDLQ